MSFSDSKLIIWMQTIDLDKNPGGAEKFIANLSRKLLIHGCKPIIIAAENKFVFPFIEYYNLNNIELKILRLPRPQIWLFGSFIYL